MASHPRDLSPEDANHDVTGWDAAKPSGDTPWYPELPRPKQKPRPMIGKVAVMILCVGAVLKLVAVAVPFNTIGGGHGIATDETAAVQNLKALATAQAQYIKKKDFYAVSGKDLNANGMLIAGDLARAFEVWQNNGDCAVPQPKAGYIYRMLQGDDRLALTNFYKIPNDPTGGMNTWGAIARPAVPGTIGENQYYITEAGTVYKLADDPSKPHSAEFFLDSVPDYAQTTWSTAK